MDEALSMRMDSRLELTKLELNRRDGHQDAHDHFRVKLWKSMIEDFELTWLKDAPSSAASRIIEMTLRKMRENRAREDAWRMFFSERPGV